MELASHEDLALGLDDVKVDLDNANTNELEQVEAPKNEKRKTRGLTLMHDITRIRSTREKIVVEYKENGVPIGENGHKLQSFIGSCVHHHISITHASWKLVQTKLKEKIYNMVEVCNHPFSFGNHANITYLLYILSHTMLWLSCSLSSQSCIYYTVIVYFKLYYVWLSYNYDSQSCIY